MRARVEIKFKSGYDAYAGGMVYGIGFFIDGDGKLLRVVEDDRLEDLAVALRQLADWVDSKLPKVEAPEPPAELTLVDP